MPFSLPEDITSLTDEELSAALDQALSEYRALSVSDESDEETLTAAEGLGNDIRALRSEQVTRAEAASTRAERLAALGDIDVPEPEPVPAAAPAPVSQETAVEPVAASAVRRAAANAPAPVVVRQPQAVILASADVPGYATGQELDSLTAAGEAIVARMRSFPTTNVGEHYARYGAVLVRREGFNDLVQDNRGDDMALLAAAGDMSRLPGGSLVAAGGWCSPSETLYDMCQVETLSGILDLPEIQVSRGGIRYTPGPDFETIYNGVGWTLTEAQVIAASPAKTCYEVPCPSFTDVRLDAVGVCVKAPILTNAAYPELVRRVVEGAMVALAHKVNARVLSTMETAAGTQIQGADNAQNLTAALGSIAWHAAVMRQRYRLDDAATIDAVAPVWLRTLIRADWALRGGVDLLSVSDAQIDAWFTVRGINIQWVYDWQATSVNAAGTSTVPAEAKVLLYPAGTWVKGVSDVISLDAVYDSTNLLANMFTAVFAEDGVLVVQKCTDTDVVQIPTCVNGTTGAQNISACFTHPGSGAVT